MVEETPNKDILFAYLCKSSSVVYFLLQVHSISFLANLSIVLLFSMFFDHAFLIIPFFCFFSFRYFHILHRLNLSRHGELHYWKIPIIWVSLVFFILVIKIICALEPLFSKYFFTRKVFHFSFVFRVAKLVEV